MKKRQSNTEDTFSIDDSVQELVAGVKKDRVGTEMNEGILAAFIERQPGTVGKVEVSDLAKRQGSGMSSATFFFAAELDEGQGRQRRELVARLHPGTGVFHEYDFAAQFKIQRALRVADLPVPAPLWLDAEGAFLGAPGFVMERIEGTAPDQAFFTTGLFPGASPEARKTMITDTILTLAKVHSVDWHSLDLEFLATRGEGQTPIEREIEWNWNELRLGKPQVMEQLEPARSWLLANQPALKTPVLVHGECNLANFVFRDNRVAAILDWELPYLGAPECDLGYMVWTNKLVSQGMSPLSGVPSEQEIKTEYERITDHKISEYDYYYTLQVFRSYIHHELAFRGLPPELLEAHRPYLQFVFNSLFERMP
jgi:aminoglycoside phosphotransferase (APT) family kinase protein